MAIIRIGSRWYFRFQFQGREYKASTALDATPSNRSAAEAIEARVRLELVEGAHGIRKIRARLFTDAAEEFLKSGDLEHRSKPNTARRDRISFASLRLFFGREIVNKIDAADVDAYKRWRIEETKIRDITLRHDLYSLSKFFRWAMARNYARENPVKLVAIPSDADAVRIYVVSRAEERAYFRHAGGTLSDVASIMLEQGCAPMEILSLRKADVDLEAGTLKIRMTQISGKRPARVRTLFLTPNTKAILARRWAGHSQWLFPSRRSRDHMKKLQTPHDLVCRKANLHFQMYAFRHTFATRFAEKTKDLPTLATILGHTPSAGLRMVLKYVHPTAEQQKRTMAEYAETRVRAETLQ